MGSSCSRFKKRLHHHPCRSEGFPHAPGGADKSATRRQIEGATGDTSTPCPPPLTPTARGKEKARTGRAKELRSAGERAVSLRPGPHCRASAPDFTDVSGLPEEIPLREHPLLLEPSERFFHRGEDAGRGLRDEGRGMLLGLPHHVDFLGVLPCVLEFTLHAR